MKRGSTLLALALALGHLLGSAGARADEAAALPALSAEALFAEGRRLMETGDFDGACERFKASDRLDPAVGTLLNLARCEKKRGHTASAWLAYREAASRAHDAGETERERVARAQADALAGTLPRLILQVPVSTRVEALELRIDGVIYPSSLWGTALPLDPGTHTLAAVAPGFERWTREVELEAPNELEAEVPPLVALAKTDPALAAPVAAPAPSPTPPIDGRRPGATVAAGPSASPWRTVGLVTTGVGAALLATAVGFAVDAAHLDQRSRQDDHCDEASGCDAPGLDLNHRALRAANTATALSIAGAAMLAGGITLTLIARAPAPARARASTVPALSAWLGRDVGVRATW